MIGPPAGCPDAQHRRPGDPRPEHRAGARAANPRCVSPRYSTKNVTANPTAAERETRRKVIGHANDDHEAVEKSPG